VSRLRDPWRAEDSTGFDRTAAGNLQPMPENAGAFPDDVPIADAIEQQRSTSDSPFGEDSATAWRDETDVPLEATDSDWQEQRETVLIDPELDESEQ
jgi:hypothetical protein